MAKLSYASNIVASTVSIGEHSSRSENISNVIVAIPDNGETHSDICVDELKYVSKHTGCPKST